jgi:hypothetical protein|tara:strand:- start:5511 stop:5876 length:366 start_codon:yes stop_codon:yes gene_type:complete
MPNNSENILSSNTHTGDSTVQTVTGASFKGDGYYGRSDGFHTVQYDVTGLLGTVSVQGTLATTPTEDDWFIISSTNHTVSTDTSTDRTGSFIYNFTGNYVWVRAYISNWTDGAVNSIKLNH